jgi:hypothetical protein
MPRGGAVSTNINDESIAVFCKMLMDAIKVNPEASGHLYHRNPDGQQCPSRALGDHLIPPVARVE